jgi:REP element-mobilizing transposase RayT
MKGLQNRNNLNKNRRSIRFKDFDYSQTGAYFITICTDNMECLLGNIKSGKVELTNIGEKAQQFWSEIPLHFKNIKLDEYIIMPNHIHGILMIFKNESVGAQYIEPHIDNKLNLHEFQKTVSNSIGSVVRSFKASVTRWSNENKITFKWQRNFYERVIRNENELDKIREYIYYNPLKRYYDKEKNNVENLFDV